MVVPVMWMVLGIVVLLVGAELLVRGASRLASLFGLSPLVVGLTIVAFGTSSPEAAVSIWSALVDKPGLAIGNAVGSNIFNILVVLGASAVIAPVSVSAKVIRREVPVMIGVTVFFWLLSLNRFLGRMEGILLVGMVIAYTVWLIAQGRQEDPDPSSGGVGISGNPEKSAVSEILFHLSLVCAGLICLVVGSDRLVHGATGLSRLLGISEPVIGLTVAAVGTSLPELATSIIAVIRGERDIAVGNVVGSNVFNLLFVLGMSATVAKNGLSLDLSMVRTDIPIMLVVTVLCLPVVITGSRISRSEGILFLSYYGLYLLWLVWSSLSSESSFVAGIWAVAGFWVTTLAFLGWILVHRNRK